MNIPSLCRTKPGTKHQTDPFTSQFIHTVLEQQRQAQKLHQQEIQSTAENPRIRDQNESTEISKELKELKHEEYVREKRRQQLRINNFELRQLEKHLRIAVTSKQLADQLNFCEDLKKQEEINKRKENELFEQERLRNLELLRQEEEKAYDKRAEFRAHLLKQINDTKAKRVDEYANVRKDREDMQKLLEKYDMEQEQERKELERRKRETRNMMETFLLENEEFKKELALKNFSDESVMLKMLEEREKDRQRLIDERRQRQEKHAALSNRIGEELYNTQEERRKHQDLLLDLLVEERNAKEEIRFRNELEKREEQRIQMRSELERHLGEVKYYKTQLQKQNEQAWLDERKAIAEKHKEQDKLKEDQKRQRMLEYKKAVLDLMEERRVMRAMNAGEERDLYEKLIKEQMEQDEEVQNERLRLLKNCSPDILRYLPVGVLKEADREHLALPESKKK